MSDVCIVRAQPMAMPPSHRVDSTKCRGEDAGTVVAQVVDGELQVGLADMVAASAGQTSTISPCMRPNLTASLHLACGRDPLATLRQTVRARRNGYEGPRRSCHAARSHEHGHLRGHPLAPQVHGNCVVPGRGDGRRRDRGRGHLHAAFREDCLGELRRGDGEEEALLGGDDAALKVEWASGGEGRGEGLQLGHLSGLQHPNVRLELVHHGSARAQNGDPLGDEAVPRVARRHGHHGAALAQRAKVPEEEHVHGLLVPLPHRAAEPPRLPGKERLRA
mmetsp:Transcript_19122/g.64053  ORF Transcript_19122/g.64053 Transcript_19122/m.64053 type:complete len:277 (-) Transcript_19122:28-858(-)